jgi:hypothetical protein
MRGHSSLRGNVDTTILVEAGDIKTATTLKQKDGEDNLQVRFRLNRVVIGTDRRGKEVTTCLVEITDEQPFIDPYSGLSGMEKRAFEVLLELSGNTQNEENSVDKSFVPRPVPASGWKDALTLAGTISGTSHETARRQFNRYRKILKDKGKIMDDGENIVALGQAGQSGTTLGQTHPGKGW